MLNGVNRTMNALILASLKPFSYLKELIIKITEVLFIIFVRFHALNYTLWEGKKTADYPNCVFGAKEIICSNVMDINV